jgi:hypothetical protein
MQDMPNETTSSDYTLRAATTKAAAPNSKPTVPTASLTQLFDLFFLGHGVPFASLQVGLS